MLSTILCAFTETMRTEENDGQAGALQPAHGAAEKPDQGGTQKDSALMKLRTMSDAEFAELDLYPDFDE